MPLSSTTVKRLSACSGRPVTPYLDNVLFDDSAGTMTAGGTSTLAVSDLATAILGPGLSFGSLSVNDATVDLGAGTTLTGSLSVANSSTLNLGGDLSTAGITASVTDSTVNGPGKTDQRVRGARCMESGTRR